MRSKKRFGGSLQLGLLENKAKTQANKKRIKKNKKKQLKRHLPRAPAPSPQVHFPVLFSVGSPDLQGLHFPREKAKKKQSSSDPQKAKQKATGQSRPKRVFFAFFLHFRLLCCCFCFAFFCFRFATLSGDRFFDYISGAFLALF